MERNKEAGNNNQYRVVTGTKALASGTIALSLNASPTD